MEEVEFTLPFVNQDEWATEHRDVHQYDPNNTGRQFLQTATDDSDLPSAGVIFQR